MSTEAFAFGSSTWPGLGKLAEECGEVIQVIGKLIATGGDSEHWDGKGDLRVRLMEEMADVAAAILFVIDYNSLSRGELQRRHLDKYERFQEWHRKGLVR